MYFCNCVFFRFVALSLMGHRIPKLSSGLKRAHYASGAFMEQPQRLNMTSVTADQPRTINLASATADQSRINTIYTFQELLLEYSLAIIVLGCFVMISLSSKVVQEFGGSKGGVSPLAYGSQGGWALCMGEISIPGSPNGSRCICAWRLETVDVQWRKLHL